MSPDRPAPRGPAWRGCAAGLAIAASLAVAACDERPRETSADPAPQQAQSPVASDASPFRTAYDTLAALPPDAELNGLRATAALSRLQGQVRPGDLALAKPLAGLARHSRSAIRATAVALIGELAAADGGATLPQAARDALVDAMGDDEEHVRLEATRAAAPLRDDAIRDAMLERLSDASSTVRFHALQGLHASGHLQPGSNARSRALALREDPDRLVRELARKTLAD
ncbi:HEAT repeat domain-containing protein [Luteimonas sp. A482]